MKSTIDEKYEVYEDLQDRCMALHEKMLTKEIPGDEKYSGIPGFEKYIGVDMLIGEADWTSFYNTCHSPCHLAFALGLSKHPCIDEMLEHDLEPDELVRQKVLSGIKILDIGCGHIPTFARCSRALGADVYTLDKDPADCFYSKKGFFSEEQKQEERKRHVCLTLIKYGIHAKEAQQILDATGGNFDLITASFLDIMGEELREIVFPLLKPNGIYFDVNEPYNCRIFDAFRKK